MKRRRFASVFVVVAAAIVPYIPGLPGDFVYDDHRLIVDNDGLKRPFDPSRAFRRDYYASDLDRTGLGYYRPLAILSNEIDYRLSGGSPVVFHSTNIFLHAACSVLVLLLSRRMFGGREAIALTAAALFALHPAHAESVAFISGRVDPLATLFVLLALLAHRASKRRIAWSWAAGGAWLAALLSKEMAVTAPVLALLLDRAEERLRWRESVRRFAPWATAAAVYLSARAWALGGLLGPATGEGGFEPFRSLVALGSYLAWLALPPPGLHLEPDPATDLFAWLAILILAVVVALAFLAWRRGARIAAMGLVWCLVTLLPVSQIRSIETALSERFLYLPSVGAMLAVTALGGGLRRPRVATAAAVLLAAAYACILVPRAVTWRDEISLWEAKEKEHGPSLKARLNLGRAQARRGNFDASREWFERAASQSPELAASIRGEMAALAGAGSNDAESSIFEALEANPGDGALWSNLGFLRLQRGDAAGAGEAFARAIERTPMRAEAWLGAAMAEARLGRLERAEEAATNAVSIDPALGTARGLLGEVRYRRGDACGALEAVRGLTFPEGSERASLERLVKRATEECPQRPLSK